MLYFAIKSVYNNKIGLSPLVVVMLKVMYLVLYFSIKTVWKILNQIDQKI